MYENNDEKLQKQQLKEQDQGIWNYVQPWKKQDQQSSQNYQVKKW